MFVFKHVPEEKGINYIPAVSRVELEVRDHVDLDDMCQAFEDFLKACGYTFDGHVEIVHEDEFDNEIEDEDLEDETDKHKIRDDVFSD